MRGTERLIRQEIREGEGGGEKRKGLGVMEESRRSGRAKQSQGKMSRERVNGKLRPNGERARLCKAENIREKEMTEGLTVNCN